MAQGMLKRSAASRALRPFLMLLARVWVRFLLLNNGMKRFLCLTWLYAGALTVIAFVGAPRSAPVWSALIAVGVFVLWYAIRLLFTVLRAFLHHRDRRRRANHITEEDRESLRKWEQAHEEAKELVEQWEQRLEDLDYITSYPTLTDLSDPLVFDAGKAYLDVVSARTDEAPEGKVQRHRFVELVNSFKMSQAAAVIHVEKIGVDHLGLGSNGRAQLTRAQDLLRLAQGTSSEHEQQTAFDQAISILEGLQMPRHALRIVSDQRDILMIETSSRDTENV